MTNSPYHQDEEQFTDITSSAKNERRMIHFFILLTMINSQIIHSFVTYFISFPSAAPKLKNVFTRLIFLKYFGG